MRSILDPVLGPFLDLVEITVVRDQRLVGLVVGPFAHCALAARNYYAKRNVLFAPFYSTTTASGLISFARSILRLRRILSLALFVGSPGRHRLLLAAQPFDANGPPCRDRQCGLPGPSPEMLPGRNHSPAVDRYQRVRPYAHKLCASSGRSGCGYGVKPYFAIFLNECSPHTGGDRGKAECGASAEGWRERLALALFPFSMGTRSRRCCCSNDSGPPSPPQPLSGPC